MAITKQLLSESTNGSPIQITSTSSPGNLIHTASSTEIDEVWLYLSNYHSSDVLVTVQWGGTATLNVINQMVPNNAGLFLAIPGLVLSNSNIVRCYADTANVVSVIGFVNRINNP